MWAVVPLKSPESAKTRLSEVLSPAARQRLLFALGKRVIDALHATHGIERVAVVTASSEVAAFARTLGATSILQQEETGTASAFSLALRELQHLHLESVLMIAGDLPLITSTALERLIAARDTTAALTSELSAPSGAEQPSAATAKSAIIVPDRHRIGTNALLCTPPAALVPCFGGESFRRHLNAAGEAGIRTRVLQIDELALDLDCAADLDELRLRDHSAADSLLAQLRDIDAKREATAPRVAGVGR